MGEAGMVVATGTTGTVGSALLAPLIAGCETLTAIGRRRPGQLRLGDHFIRADLSDPAELSTACADQAGSP